MRRALFHALLQFLVGTAQRLLSLGALGDLRLQRTGHEVEGLGQSADFIARGDRHAGVEATCGDGLCAFGYFEDRVGQAARQPQAQAHRPHERCEQDAQRPIERFRHRRQDGVVGSEGDQPPFARLIGAVGP